MSQFKGTQGKWFVEWNGHYNEILSTDNSIHNNTIDGVNMGISTHLHMTIGGKVESVANSIEDRANAQLIANAPEMLEMLNRLVSTLEDIQSTLSHHNLSIVGYHLNGNEEPIMNFFSDIDMSSIDDAKLLIESATNLK